MAKAKDLTGQKFGDLIVLERDYDYVKTHNIKQNRSYWKCQCKCGNIITIVGSSLTAKNGRTQCKECSNKEKIHDLSGQIFGYLKVLKMSPQRAKNRNVQWICQCKCGNIIEVNSRNLVTGCTKSCGCLKHELAITDLTGKKFSRLLVLKNVPPPETVKHKCSYWLCQCDCGNQIIVSSHSLTSGNTQSCGCLAFESHNFSDLTGQKFGKLTAIKKVKVYNKTNSAQWLCKCDCGKEKIVSASCLRSGDTQSCGCLVSKGEDKILKLLIDNNIKYVQQKTFDTCRFNNGYLAKFDFYINDSFLLEFDGIQHFTPLKSGWATEESVLAVQERDKIKNEWCRNNNIPLKRIPYWDLNNLTIDDILNDKYLIK